MEISGEFEFDVPRHEIWNALQDPRVLENVLPGGQQFEQIGDNHYRGILEVKIGTIQTKFEGQIKLSDFRAPESYFMEVDGRSAAGVMKASGRLRMIANDNRTNLEYTGTVHINGRIASVGNRLIENFARSIIRQSLESLNAYLKGDSKTAIQQPSSATLTPAGTNESLAAVPTTTKAQPPSAQDDMKPTATVSGTNRAQSIFDGVVPPQYRLWLIGVAIVLIILVIWLITSRS